MLLLCSLVAAAAALAPHAAVVRALLERAEVDVHLLEQAEEIYYVRRAAQKIVVFCSFNWYNARIVAFLTG